MKVMERLNGIDIARLRAEGRIKIANHVKATKSWRMFTRIPVIGIAIGLAPFVFDPSYTLQNYGEDVVCGAIGGCGDMH